MVARDAVSACSRRASDCICSSSRGAYETSLLPPGLLEHCTPGPACFNRAIPQRSTPSHSTALAHTTLLTSIVLVISFEPATVRPAFQHDAWGSYYAAILGALRLVLSLRRVQTALPISLLVSGLRNASFEALLTQLDVRIIEGQHVPPPPWSHFLHRGSFSTLALLNLTQFDRVLFLEHDAIVTANIDWLAHSAPAPSFVNFFDDFQCAINESARGAAPTWLSARGLRSDADRERARHAWWHRITRMAGLILLEPAAAKWRRMRTLLELHHARPPLVNGSTIGDRGSQTFWILMFPHYHELPVGFNAYMSAHLREGEWARVHVLHDATVHMRKLTFGAAGYGELMRNLTAEAWRRVQSVGGGRMANYGHMRAMLEMAHRHAAASQRANRTADPSPVGRTSSSMLHGHHG